MIVQEKRTGQLGFTQAARGFGETRGREIEQRQGNEERKIVHARVEASNQPRGGEQLVVRLLGIGGKLRDESVRVPVFFR